MEEAIRDFHKQFLFKPEVVNADKLPRAKKFVVGGMGGSHLSAGLLAVWKPELDIIIHRDYGLPAVGDAHERLFIASSYSGNTEETLDFAKVAGKKRYDLAVVTVGGKLLAFAKAKNLPHVVLPDAKIQPRSALGFSLGALLALMRQTRLREELALLAQRLSPASLEGAGRELAKILQGRVPIVCSSARNAPVALNWKIKFNETGKIPAFFNVFPELNHSEMTGFDVIPATRALSERFHFVFLTDRGDNPRIVKRMALCKKLYKDRGLPVAEVPLEGHSVPEKIFRSLLVADWTAFHAARFYGAEPE
ncbi:MAG: glucose/mannose-6-phosphate isomerase [Parcubacteria group bacterium Greene0416_79]|nr:MAG: glucose/mannose-6-phosphate isomerase [Parcubacteria group bacterium Greene0416_79]